MSLDLTAIILTKNEAIHIYRCIENIKLLCKKVYVVDCFSTDGTQEIARALGAEVVEHEWPGNQAAQFNWALENLRIDTEWVLRLDADEYLSYELKENLIETLPNLPKDISAVDMERKLFFLGKQIKGGNGKTFFTRIFKPDKAKCVSRRMDEHIEVLAGGTIRINGVFFDDNHNNLTWWINKHNDYAIREAAELLEMEFSSVESTKSNKRNLSVQAKRKKQFYTRLPLFTRSFIYFIYRYIVKGGFLEGKEGFIWCFLQGWWYRTLVDAKIYEIKKVCGNDYHKIRYYMLNHYNIELK
ncbi:MAG: glycosyltransferase family 2 protein [Bacteroides sp.]|nr:glycosyltransferase family 2 protein [Bacteroides sp.]